MTTLVVDKLFKHYGGVLAVNGISFEVGTGEFVSLLGPSGCGKTTTLRCIAGFERPDGGRILIDGEPVVDVRTGAFTPPNKRHFGMVFQSYAIWPHMKVADNVGYPLKVRGRLSNDEIRERVADKLRIVGLAGYEERYPSQISGGQQQRVALARALVMEPRALLFDEPLSNLDAKLRERMRFELIAIQSRLGIPAVYVTHDQSEAMVMSKRIIVMERGSIAQEGAPEDIYARPRSRFVADFIGLSNFIEGEAEVSLGGEAWRVRCGFGSLECMSDRQLAVGEKVVVALRPEAVQITTDGLSGTNSFGVMLKECYFLGPHCEYFLRAGDIDLRAQNSRRLPVQVGKPLHIHIPRESCRVLS